MNPRCLLTLALLFVACICSPPLLGGERGKIFQAGAAQVDVTPKDFPVIVNGGFLSNTAKEARDKLFARCLVLDDGKNRIAMVVVDSCMLPRELCDDIKMRVNRKAGLTPDRILIAATHTHSAPSLMGSLGTDPDPKYPEVLAPLVAHSVEEAVRRLQPAKIGWTVVDASAFTNCRRWIHRPDRVGMDPFGKSTVRAMMHPGYQNADYLGPSGPIDPGLSLLGVQTAKGMPLALLANFSMHYFGTGPVSADYFGRFCEESKKILGGNSKDHADFVAIMSQGTSGDLHWMDYSKKRKDVNIDDYSKNLANLAIKAWKQIQFLDHVDLAMAQSTLKLKRRTPDEERLAWAKNLIEKMAGRPPRNQPEVYAREQIHLHREPVRELILQAVRIGDLAITAIPDEVYGITGLHLKGQSPLPVTFNMSLANGSEGYIPPPEQHVLGGYTTWPARTAGLEVAAEPKIVEQVLSLLEKVSGKKRKRISGDGGIEYPYPKAILAAKPLLYWRMGEWSWMNAKDCSGNGHHGKYEPGVAFYLEGPSSSAFSGAKIQNRSPHFAGGRVKVNLKTLEDRYSVEMWVNNYLPNNLRPVTGYFFSRGPEGDKEAPGDHLGIGGVYKEVEQGKLVFFNGNERGEVLVGKTVINPKEWCHLVLVREGDLVTVFLNGKLEMSGKISQVKGKGSGEIFVGGRCDNFANFEGRLDEVAIYPHLLTPEEISRHYRLTKVSR